jgi:hypothetical protein
MKTYLLKLDDALYADYAARAKAANLTLAEWIRGKCSTNGMAEGRGDVLYVEGQVSQPGKSEEHEQDGDNSGTPDPNGSRRLRVEERGADDAGRSSRKRLRTSRTSAATRRGRTVHSDDGRVGTAGDRKPCEKHGLKFCKRCK